MNIKPLQILLGLLIAILFTAGCGGGLFRDHEVTQAAFEAAQANPQVIAALGEPVEIKGIISGSIETMGISGEAVLQISLSGPNGDATLHAGARRENGIWTFYTLLVEIKDTGELIPLQ